jgi:fructose-like PTS system EIIC or EIIBC or EIIABC component
MIMVELMKNMKKHLLTGVSYMIPFTVAGGVLLAISVMLSGQASVPEKGFLGALAQVGTAGLSLYVAILGGFIAYSMVDRAGLGPGIISAYLAYELGGGFLGGMVAGIVAGIVVYYLKKIKGPKTVATVIPIFIIPLLGTFISGMIVVLFIGQPVANLMEALSEWLLGMQDSSKIMLGIILGAMMAFDMGGPFNKTAFFFAVAVMDTYPQLLAAVAVAGCTPPLGLALASTLFKNKFNVEEREAGKAAYIMGAIGITEGAIPFAAADPLRVISSIMVGGAAGAVTSLLLGASNFAPWGGLIVLPVVEGRLSYIIAIIVGTAVTTCMVGLLKQSVESTTKQSVYKEDDDFELEFD